MNRFYAIALISISLLTMKSQEKSPYITKVIDYSPAPGQFINTLPEYEDGDSKENIITKVQEAISGTEKGMISLGGYGGSVTFGFDHLIVNVKDAYDFTVWGNAFDGSSEPGIVMVSYDANGNGLADDEWYELAGSEYAKSETKKNYQITYYKPDENNYEAETYAKWTDNTGITGYIPKNTFHKQPYYPQWVSESTIDIEGTCLAPNGEDRSGVGTYFYLKSYDWGYVDNVTNGTEAGNFKIDWAINKSGESVYLPGINFVKVYTGMNQVCGWLGETSTEITGAEDLHVGAGVTDAVIGSESVQLLSNLNDRLIINCTINNVDAVIYTINGSSLGRTQTLTQGLNELNIENLQSGIYILNIANQSFKFIKK